MKKFFSRFFNINKLDAKPSQLSDSAELGFDSAVMDAVLAEIDIDIAIASHEHWKLLLQNILDGESSESSKALKPEVVCQDKRCDLGKWLYGPGEQRLGHYPAFQMLIARHKYFHAQAAAVVAQAQSGDIEKARQTLNSPYRQASSQVILLLKQLKRGLER